MEEGAERDEAKDRKGKPDKVIPPDNAQLIKAALDNDIKYTKKVVINGRTVTASKNAGEALEEVTEQRGIMKRIINCV